MMFDYEQIINTICLLIVALACIAHLAQNVNRHSPGCERWGFVLTGAGAFGQAVYVWWPRIESFPFEPLMHIGMALIAASLLRGHLRGWIANAPGFHFIDRRTHEDRS